jgi:hypothetical protein
MNEIYTNNWNQRWDAYKKELDANLSEIYSIKSNQKTAIHTLEYEHNIQIPIHFKCKVNGLYNLNVNGVDNNYLWTLTDHKENTTYNLLNTNSFEFTANTTDNLHRFTLNGIEIPFFETHQNDCESVGNIMLYNHSNSEWILSISDELGNTVINHQLYDSLSVENLSAGTYTVIFTNPEYLFEKIETFVIEEVTVPVANFELSSNTYQVDEFIYFQNNSINATNYFWEFGDGMESTLQNPSHSYSNAGTYTVKLLSNSELCFDEFSQNITIIPSLGLVDWNDSEITFFVNNKKAYVNIPAFKNAPYYLNIFDLTGKMVKSIQINNAYSILDLSDLKIGIYAFNLYNNQFSESYKRLID